VSLLWFASTWIYVFAGVDGDEVDATNPIVEEYYANNTRDIILFSLIVSNVVLNQRDVEVPRFFIKVLRLNDL